MTLARSITFATTLFACASASVASVQKFWGDFEGWKAAAGSYSIGTFTEFSPGTIVTNQYAALGVNINNVGPVFVQNVSFSLFPQDGYGVDANGPLDLVFDDVVHAVGGHGPGAWRFKLYLGGALVYTSNFWPGEPNGFAGLVSDTGFDRAVFDVLGEGDDVYMDNVYFSTIPAPGSIGVLLIGALMRRGRRR